MAYSEKTDRMLKTRYADWSDSAVYQLFAEKGWKGLTPVGRLEALQELECRMALKQGREACVLHRKHLKPGIMGYFDCKKIVISDALLADARSRFGMSSAQRAMEALDTVIHEGRHAFQRAVITGNAKVDVPNKVKREWLVNMLDYESSDQNDGSFAFYAFQPLDRDAREYAARALVEIYKDVKKNLGRPDSFFESGIAAMRKYKQHEYLIAKNSVKADDLRSRIAKLRDKLKSVSTQMLQTYLPYMDKQVTLAECMQICGFRSEDIDEMAEEHYSDIIDILTGEKGMDDFMDGLDDASLYEKFDSIDDACSSDKLDNVVAAILERAAKTRTDTAGIQVRPDGMKGF